MKKKNALFLLEICIGICFLLFSACGQETTAPKDRPVVSTSFYPVYLLALSVAEGTDAITLKNMAQPQTGCLHDYQLTTGDRKLIYDSDLFIINGAGMEAFLSDALLADAMPIILDTSIHAELLEEHTGHSHGGGEEEEEGNAHIWLSIPNAVKQIETIADAFSKLDSKNANLYQKNAEALTGSLLSLWQETTDRHTKVQKVGIFHEGFPYLIAPFSLEADICLYADENDMPTAREIALAIDTIQKEHITLLFAADDLGRPVAETIARETKAKLVILDPITSGTAESGAYLASIQKNYQLIEEALYEYP